MGTSEVLDLATREGSGGAGDFGDDIEDGGWQSVVSGADLVRVHFKEDFDVSPAGGWWIGAGETTCEDVVVDGPDVYWYPGGSQGALPDGDCG
jgi:hypothetical protein